MELKRFIFEILLILVLVLIGAIFGGVTGKIILDDSVKSICSSDKDCSNGEVCCGFYNQETGVCNNKDMCEKIISFTKEEKLEYERMKNILYEKPSEKRVNYLWLTISCLAIIIVVMILFIKKEPIHMKRVPSRKKYKKEYRKNRLEYFFYIF
ncbi:MAG: hypothetical protein Q8N99_05860 [Nanoarchaeota archaeon]|nr:hypothetical protein [Nanoarchaeota archaeon]